MPSYLGEDCREPIVFPLGLAYIASMIDGGHELMGWDPNLEQDAMNRLKNVLESFNPDVVCVSFRNVDSVFSDRARSYYDPFVAMVKQIKQVLPHCKLVVGGAGFSIFAEEIMRRNPEIDYGIVSEGELSFPSLLKNFGHPERVKNLVMRKDGKVISTDRGEFVEFDKLPCPKREYFDLEKYKRYPFAIGVQSSRGCMFGCIYCLHRFLMGRNYRLRSPKKVIDEIENLVFHHGINTFYFVDPVFNVPPDHARELCREIKKRKLEIRWEGCFRPDFLNMNFMQEAVQAGCQLFDFSPDGASDEAMRILGKDMSINDIEKTIHWASKVEEAKVAYEFVYDLPYANKSHIFGLMRLFPKIMSKCGGKLRYLTLTKMRVYPNTPLYLLALKQGKLDVHTDLLYPFYYKSHSSRNPYNIFPYLLKGSSIIFATLCKRFTF
jgi:radical SAM superfamily enzyme YgiQ (UPF0313 family)